MTREETLQYLYDLRAAGVAEAHFHDGALAFVQFFPSRPAPPAVDDDRPLPRPPRTADERLFGPLKINDGQPKAGDG